MLSNLRPLAFVLLASIVLLTSFVAQEAAAQTIAHLQGEMAGEPTPTSIILQSRLTAPAVTADGDVPGVDGVACFEIADNSEFTAPRRTAWLTAHAEYDHIVKVLVDGLRPGTTYYYRLVYGPNRTNTQTGPTRRFRTLPARDDADTPLSLAIVTGMNYAFFHHGQPNRPTRASEEDRRLGYPALRAMMERKPDIFVGTGDNVYYDHPAATAARTPEEMRRKWREQFVQPRFSELFSTTPTYWEKDDHDHRYNDNDNTGNREPSSELGIRIFNEQVPVVDPLAENPVTYRTHRMGKWLQVWLLEGRDYRSPNRMPDGPEKTLWGAEQLAWLKRTLVESDAAFKLIISPTPLVGPDDGSKRDNHTNIGGFQHEGREFIAWAKEQGLIGGGLYVACGDRHWQYHSIHPSGLEEFSCGALVDENSRLGVKPGAPRGTDPEGLIEQPFTSPTPTGGFLHVRLAPPADGQGATLHFDIVDDEGTLLYSVARPATTKP